MTKLVNGNQNDWDVMLLTTLWAYWTAYKVSTQHTPYELVYGLMSLLPIEFINPTTKQLRKRMGLDECVTSLNGRPSLALMKKGS